MKNFIKKLRLGLLKRINTLENENEHLKETIQDELYTKFMGKLNESVECKRLKEQNKTLREQNKRLKEALKSNLKGKRATFMLNQLVIPKTIKHRNSPNKI